VEGAVVEEAVVEEERRQSFSDRLKGCSP